MKPTNFLVIYDDGDCIRSPYTWDTECSGALCGSSDGDPIALFTSRYGAQQAIRISAAWARLCAAKGQPINEDFTTHRKNVKIVPLITQPAK